MIIKCFEAYVFSWIMYFYLTYSYKRWGQHPTLNNRPAYAIQYKMVYSYQYKNILSSIDGLFFSNHVFS